MSANSLTPMLRQYHELKSAHPGALLFFRLGDFYELFYDDAIIGARELDITLTARHKETAHPVPMCGVPHHAASTYIARLVRKGYRVAICEQTESPEAGKKLVRREVVRIITPGTAIDSQLVDSGEAAYLAAVSCQGDKFGVAFLDVTTGEFHATETQGADAMQKAFEYIDSYAPRELLHPTSIAPLLREQYKSHTDPPVVARISSVSDAERSKPTIPLTGLDDWLWESNRCDELLCKQFGVRSLEAFNLNDKPAAISAAGICLHYAREMQRLDSKHIGGINYFERQGFLVLDSVTVRNLELLESQSDAARSRSLLKIIDHTKTAMGARLLRSWLMRPSVNRGEINARLDAVEELHASTMNCDALRRLLNEVQDIERLIGRVNLNTATPRDFSFLSRALAQIPHIKKLLSQSRASLLQVLVENLDELSTVKLLIDRHFASDGDLPSDNAIKAGISAELDELRDLSGNVKEGISEMEARERSRTGLNNLKIRSNGVFGYYIEVPRAQAARVPENYQRRQTLANAERYTTPELQSLEQRTLGADERIAEIEAELLTALRQQVSLHSHTLQATARAFAMLDVLAGLAAAARQHRYVKPVLHESDEIEIRNGRHALIEAFSSTPFIPNDLYMNNSTDRLLIITGPNMGGKSTILRQVGLIVVLAQIGSFVPAEYAKLPIFDRVWTRVGASDDISRGRSTFMVEMTEMAAIMHGATPRSLVLLDEIGRGTATFDGLSIAWAVAEYLHNSPENAAKTLFATHYHELTELAEQLPGAQNYHIKVAERDDAIFFLYKFERGSASKSYGVEVARIAGLPQAVIGRAREVLATLEKYELRILKEAAQQDSQNDFVADIPEAEHATKALTRRATGKRLASQATLFAATNDKLLDEIRETKASSLNREQLQAFIESIQSRII
ncbi:MAG: DNA mismatch repair protein MutS [Pyrinomonadaceae bacterium MAG19_C2-C3]|nr:DNA mismatch repair protein MutS [Pyrinomonadaceae bacterium MAG19_C2-C3]